VLRIEVRAEPLLSISRRYRFGEDTVAKMVNWCLKNMPPENHPSVLEVGSGNGILLLNLAENGYEPSNMLGVDYSVDAVELARKVASIRDTRFASILYSSCDFLEESVNESDGARRSFDLVLDKGTFDAMTLAQETDSISRCQSSILTKSQNIYLREASS
jgi:ubiquinone/menaquinone biosynthesis C-methylase UbiE